MEATVELTSTVGTPRLEPPTVLIVDDDPVIAEGLDEFLHDEGFEVASARDGHAALEQLRRGLRPSAIVLDLMMPVMDGWDFRQEQVKDPELCDIPVILITATGFSAASLKAQLGDVEVVSKPPSLPDLLATIRRHCGQRRVR